MKRFIKYIIDLYEKPLSISHVGVSNYNVVILNRGYVLDHEGLEHRWHVNANRATCLICGQIIEKQLTD